MQDTTRTEYSKLAQVANILDTSKLNCLTSDTSTVTIGATGISCILHLSLRLTSLQFSYIDLCFSMEAI